MKLEELRLVTFDKKSSGKWCGKDPKRYGNPARPGSHFGKQANTTGQGKCSDTSRQASQFWVEKGMVILPEKVW